MLKIAKELLELRKNQPKFKFGQTVWAIKTYETCDFIELRTGEITAIFKEGNYAVGEGVYREEEIFATKSEAQRECDRRNKEVKK